MNRLIYKKLSQWAFYVFAIKIFDIAIKRNIFCCKVPRHFPTLYAYFTMQIFVLNVPKKIIIIVA